MTGSHNDKGTSVPESLPDPDTNPVNESHNIATSDAVKEEDGTDNSEDTLRHLEQAIMGNNDNNSTSSDLPIAYGGQPIVASYITGIHVDSDSDCLASISRQPLERQPTNYSFFNSKLKSQRKRLLARFGLIYLIMATLVLGIFSIYWGSMVNRGSRFKNLQMLVVIEDDLDINGIPPIIGDNFKDLLQTPEVKYLGNWNFFNLSQWKAIAGANNRTSEQEIQLQIHNQLYWSALHIQPNASYNWVQAVIEGDTNYNVSERTIINTYETGRDFINMNSYITPSIEQIETWWLSLQSNVSRQLVSHISNRTVFLQQESLDVLASPMSFVYDDRVQWTDYVLVAPSQVGLIYMIIITFFQFNFFADLHKEVSMSKLKPYHYYMYRILSALLSYCVLSLCFGLVSLACQIDFTVTYGKLGFLVYWAIAFLTMVGVGTVNEIMGLLLILVYPPVLGFWLLFWVIINITPTFTPLALSAKFFRYGYALPIHNSYEATKTVFFNIHKGQMGRNIGILVAWAVLSNIALIPVLKLFTTKMSARAKKAAAEAKEREALKAEAKDEEA